jgi:hypothetical protein
MCGADMVGFRPLVAADVIGERWLQLASYGPPKIEDSRPGEKAGAPR